MFLLTFQFIFFVDRPFFFQISAVGTTSDREVELLLSAAMMLGALSYGRRFQIVIPVVLLSCARSRSCP